MGNWWNYCRSVNWNKFWKIDLSYINYFTFIELRSYNILNVLSFLCFPYSKWINKATLQFQIIVCLSLINFWVFCWNWRSWKSTFCMRQLLLTVILSNVAGMLSLYLFVFVLYFVLTACYFYCFVFNYFSFQRKSFIFCI